MLDIIVLLLFIYRFKIVQPQEKNYLILYSYTTASILVALGLLHSRTNLSWAQRPGQWCIRFPFGRSGFYHPRPEDF